MQAKIKTPNRKSIQPVSSNNSNNNTKTGIGTPTKNVSFNVDSQERLPLSRIGTKDSLIASSSMLNTNSSSNVDNNSKNKNKNSTPKNPKQSNDNKNVFDPNTIISPKDAKNISIFYRPSKRKQPYKPSEVDFHVGVDLEHFGNPSYTIGSSRKPSLHIDSQMPHPGVDTPAPGEYNPILLASMVYPNRYPHTMSRADSSLHSTLKVETEMSSPSNINIDYLDPTVYKQMTATTKLAGNIGDVSHAPQFYTGDLENAATIPACDYAPSQDLLFDGPKISIANRKLRGYETDNPGPGTYSPKSNLLARAPKFPFNEAPPIRYDWLNDKRNGPSPDQYSPQRLERTSPQFSIGSKSRINRDMKKKKEAISEESTRIALLNAESRKAATSLSHTRRGKKQQEECNYYIPNDTNNPRPKSGLISKNSSNLSDPRYLSDRLNNSSSLSRRQKENEATSTNKPTRSNLSFGSYNYPLEETDYNDKGTVYSSFYTKCVNVNSNPKGIVPFPIGHFIMKLDINDISINEVRRYINKHRDFPEWVDFIINSVLEVKCEDPIMFIREFFAEMKKEDEKKETILTDDENLDQLLRTLKENQARFVF